MRKFWIWLMLCLAFVVGCEEQKPEIVYEDVYKTIQVVSEVDEYEAWNHSEYHPEKVFDEWLEWQAESSNICNELTKLSSLDLTVFENQIRDPKYRVLVERCYVALVRRLDDYWKKEKDTVPVGKIDFKFASERVPMESLPRQKIINQVTGAKQVLLTFDDGPHPEYTEKLLAIFRQADVKVLFFLLGKNIETMPDTVVRIARDGHAVGSHTDTHHCIALNSRCRNFNNKAVNESQSQEEIDIGVTKLINVLGWTHPFFRFPYGESSPALQEYIYSKGFFDFYWSIDSEDWKKRNLSEYYQSIVDKVEQQKGGNILFHDIQKRTLEVMVPFLRYLHKNNYTIVVTTAKPVKSF